MHGSIGIAPVVGGEDGAHGGFGEAAQNAKREENPVPFQAGKK